LRTTFPNEITCRAETAQRGLSERDPMIAARKGLVSLASGAVVLPPALSPRGGAAHLLWRQ